MSAVISGTRAPGRALLWTDFGRSLGELGSLACTWPVLAAAPRGDGHPVLVIPGLSTSDRWTHVLRGFLRAMGYTPYGWGLGRNIGPTSAVVHGLPERLAEIRRRHDAPVSLIGWSLGGIFARRLAREQPDSVRQVITLGSPFRLARHEQSNARGVYAWYRHRHVEELELLLEEGKQPLPVPATSVYSRFDGIVAWRVCLDRPSERAENIEVLGSHYGFGHHPAVLWAVADRLAQPADSWAPFCPPGWLQRCYPAPAGRQPGPVTPPSP